MSRTASPSPLRSPQLEVRLPPLSPWQSEVLADPARFKVVVAGRQSGKTVLGACRCVGAALQGGDIWWVAPTFPIGQHGWRLIDQLCRQIPGTRFEGRPIFRITLPTGGTIQLASADNPGSLRGATLDGAVFDEAAMAKPEAWPTLEPTLAVRGGWAMFISTPKGNNWFRELYLEAQALPGWAAWRFPSSASPYLTAQGLEQARRRIGSLYFSEEYEAEFIAAGTAYFRAEWVQHYRTEFVDDERVLLLGDERIPLADCRTFHTVDLAWSQRQDADYTVISSWAVTKRKHLILLDVVRGRLEAPDVVPRLRLAYERWGGVVKIERASRQLSVIQQAMRDGLPVQELRADKDKEARSALAQARMEQHQVWFPPASTPWFPEIEEELLVFPNGKHDDFVDTLSYAAIEVAKGGGTQGVVWV